MSETPDPEVVELATKVFDLARRGETDALAAYVDAGVPANLTNDRGDSLLMLAAYHGHAAAVTALVGRGADPTGPTTAARRRSPGPFSRARTRSSRHCSRRGPIRPPERPPPSTRPACSARPTCWNSSALADRVRRKCGRGGEMAGSS